MTVYLCKKNAQSMCASLLFLTAAFFGGSLPDEQSGLERLERFDHNK